MKGSIWLFVGIGALVLLGVLLFGGKLFAKTPDSGNANSATGGAAAQVDSLGASRLPGESISSWIFRRNSEGWAFV